MSKIVLTVEELIEYLKEYPPNTKIGLKEDRKPVLVLAVEEITINDPGSQISSGRMTSGIVEKGDKLISFQHFYRKEE